MVTNISALKSRFCSLLKSSKRTGVEDMLAWLDATDFYTAPASTRYHGAYEGGLLEHSLGVYDWAKRLDMATRGSAEVDDFPEPGRPVGEVWKDDSLIVVCLLHDICKVNFYTVSTRNVKDERTGVWHKVPCYTVQEQNPFGGHGSKSMWLVEHFIPLTMEEAAAINCHMGPWDRQDYGKPGEVYAVSRLAWILHAADEAESYLGRCL